MASPSEAELKKKIHAILKKADLATMTAKKVRQQLEDKLKVDLGSRKKEIDKIVMDYVNEQNESEDDKDDDENEEEKDEENGKENDEENDEENNGEENAESSEEDIEEKKTSKKRGAPAKKTPAKKAKKGSDESESEASNASDDYKPGKKAAPKKKKAAKKKDSDSDSDTDWGKKSKKKGGGRGKGSGYTREIKLSPALADLMGKSSMARHEVVRKMWALIKERNLYDKSNRQFAICDDDLYKVIGIKRFRTFGMMKYLKNHFKG